VEFDRIKSRWIDNSFDLLHIKTSRKLADLTPPGTNAALRLLYDLAQVYVALSRNSVSNPRRLSPNWLLASKFGQPSNHCPSDQKEPARRKGDRYWGSPRDSIDGVI
jgi:hypothetical protein